MFVGLTFGNSRRSFMVLGLLSYLIVPRSLFGNLVGFRSAARDDLLRFLFCRDDFTLTLFRHPVPSPYLILSCLCGVLKKGFGGGCSGKSFLSKTLVVVRIKC